MQLQIRIAEPVPEFGDLRLVATVQMLTRAENLYRGDSGMLDFTEQCRGQSVIDEQMRGQYVLHRVPSVQSSIRTACPNTSLPVCRKYCGAANPGCSRLSLGPCRWRGPAYGSREPPFRQLLAQCPTPLTLVSFRRTFGTGIRRAFQPS